MPCSAKLSSVTQLIDNSELTEPTVSRSVIWYHASFFFSHLNTQRYKQKKIYDHKLHLEVAYPDAEDGGPVRAGFAFSVQCRLTPPPTTIIILISNDPFPTGQRSLSITFDRDRTVRLSFPATMTTSVNCHHLCQ